MESVPPINRFLKWPLKKKNCEDWGTLRKKMLPTHPGTLDMAMAYAKKMLPIGLEKKSPN